MISSQDFEHLSSYLDNQLSPKEKAALEARLAQEPELKAALDDLLQTVRALRSLPVIRPPRNFTLSAKQVGAAPQRRFFPLLQLATSMATLALVLVFAGDFIASRTPALSPAAPAQYTAAQRNVAPSETATLAVAKAAAPAPAAVPTEMMDQSAAGAAASGGATGGNLVATPTSEANTPMAAAVMAAPPITAATPTSEANTPMAAAIMAAPSITAATPASEANTPMAAAIMAASPATAATSEPTAAAKLAPTEVPASPAPTETIAPPAAEAFPPPTSERAAPPVELPVSAPGAPWRVAEIGLIGLTLFLAALTWLMRRR